MHRIRAITCIVLTCLVSPIQADDLGHLGFDRPASPKDLKRAAAVTPKPSATNGCLHIRTIGAPPALPHEPSPLIRKRRERFQDLIAASARRHGIDPRLVHAVIRQESAYKPDAQSHAGASGLMQLMPATAERFGVRDIWDPAQNVEGGVRYLAWLLDHFDGDLRLALAGYNAGENAVKRYGNQVPPYRETQGYVAKVMRYLGRRRA